MRKENPIQMDISVTSFANMGYLELDVPEKLFTLLKKECDTALVENETFKSGLTQGIDLYLVGADAGVTSHRYVESVDVLQELKNHIFSLINVYKKQFLFDPADTRTLTKSLPFSFDKPWINYQKKFDFVPNHYHQGVFSYTIWMNIPFKNEGTFAGNFEFTYNSIEGVTRSEIIEPTAGKMILFPSKIFHQVYPFYTSDEYRISISGNVSLDSEINRVKE
jgi:hypothetical protein